MSDHGTNEGRSFAQIAEQLHESALPSQEEVVRVVDGVLETKLASGVQQRELTLLAARVLGIKFYSNLNSLASARNALGGQVMLLVSERLDHAHQLHVARELRQADDAQTRAHIQAASRQWRYDSRLQYAGWILEPKQRGTLRGIIARAYSEKSDLPEGLHSMPEQLDEISVLENQMKALIAQLPGLVAPLIRAALAKPRPVPKPRSGYVVTSLSVPSRLFSVCVRD